MLEALKGEAGMLDTAPSAIEFKMAIKDMTRMKPTMSVAERVHHVNTSTWHEHH